MPLTPEDVSNKRFTPVRLREGYDMGEVDQFLDEVETELARLYKENDDLRAQLAAAQAGAPVAVAAAPEPVTAPEPVAEAPAPVAAPVVAQAPETIRVETVADASGAAARLLELATRNADELIAGAKNDADQIVGSARTTAERLEAESKASAEKIEQDARTRAHMLDAETAAKRTEMLGELEKEREKLSAEIERLRSFEREYRSRLKTYFSQQLEALNVSVESTTLPGQVEDTSAGRRASALGE